MVWSSGINSFVVEEGEHQCFDLGFLQKTFLVAGKSVNTKTSIAVLIPDRTGGSSSRLPWRCFSEAMDPGRTWKWSLQIFPSVLLSARLELVRPKSSRTLVCAVSLLMPSSSAINISVSRPSCASICLNFSIISGILLVDGRPKRGSSAVVFFLSRKRLNYSKTHFLLKASLPYICTNISRVSIVLFPNL